MTPTTNIPVSPFWMKIHLRTSSRTHTQFAIDIFRLGLQNFHRFLPEKWLPIWTIRELSLQQLCAEGNRLIRDTQGHLSTRIMKSRDQAFRHERPNLLVGEIHDGDHELSH